MFIKYIYNSYTTPSQNDVQKRFHNTKQVEQKKPSRLHSPLP
jgi:hypothetical protein